MIIFLPYPSFVASVQALDDKRLFKQMIECRSAIAALEHRGITNVNHPAVLAWKGYTDALKAYFNEALKEWTIYREYKCSFPCYMADMQNMWEAGDDYVDPWWLGREEYHKAMRSRLLSKDKEFYLTRHPDWIGDVGYNQGMYWYPCKDGRHNFYRQDTKLLLDKPDPQYPIKGGTYRLIYEFSGKSFKVKITDSMQIKRISNSEIVDCLFDNSRKKFISPEGIFNLYIDKQSLFYK